MKTLCLIVGFLCRFVGLWIAEGGYRLEAWAGVKGWGADDWKADEADWKVGGTD